jgi:hypothetical protein
MSSLVVSLAGMNEGKRLRGLPVAGAAFGGVVVGHWLSYLLAIPGPRIRSEVLAETGHQYWLTAVKLALVLAVIALASAAVRQVGAVLRREPDPTPGPRALALRLATLQLAGFLALEATERLAAGAPLSTLLSHHVLALGLLVQVLIAGILALVLSLVVRAVRAVARAFVRAPVPRLVLSLPGHPAPFVLRPALIDGPASPRGPPSP